MADLSVLVVAYGAELLLEKALTPFVGHPEVDVLVVDNSSSDAVRRVTETQGHRYLDAGGNLGFGAGVNLGLRHLDASTDVLLLNPDAVVDVTTAKELRRRVWAGPRVACAAPAQEGDGGIRQQVLWPFPTPFGAWLDAVRIRVTSARPNYVIGSVLLLRRDAINDVGGFDERFFLYAEEADWQRRAVERGWTVSFCEDLSATHVGAATSSDDRLRNRLFAAGQERYIRKWHGPMGWQSYRAAQIVGAGLRTIAGGREGRRGAARRAAVFFRGPVRLTSTVQGRH